jgi:hypothetical protein
LVKAHSYSILHLEEATMSSSAQTDVQNGHTTAAEPTSDPSANGQNGHDARGRFTKGNPGGRGNPFARKVAALRAAFLKDLTRDDIKEIAATLKAQAKKGDVAAARLLLAYSLGKPDKAVDVDRLDADEWQVIRGNTATAAHKVRETVVGGPLSLFSEMVMAARPHLVEHHVAKFVKKGRKQMERDRRRAARKAEKKQRMAEMRAAQVADQPVSRDAESAEGSADRPDAQSERNADGASPPEAPSTDGI